MLPGDATLAVSDMYHIRLVAVATGATSTLAGGPGNAAQATTDGFGAAARFSGAGPLALNPAGTMLYTTSIATSRNIRSISLRTGEVATIASIAGPACQDGPASNNNFWQPYGIATGPGANSIYANSCCARIRLINTVTTYASTVAGDKNLPGWSYCGWRDGVATQALFSMCSTAGVSGMSTDAVGNLYLADFSNHRIRKYSCTSASATPTPTPTSTFGSSPSSTPQPSASPSAAPSAAPAAYRVPQCYLTTIAGPLGGFTDGSGGQAGTGRFSGPLDIVFAPSGAAAYVSDRQGGTSGRIRTLMGFAPGVLTNALHLDTLAGIAPGGGNCEYNSLVGASRFPQPAGLAVLGRQLLVVDTACNSIRGINLDTGWVTLFAGTLSSGAAGPSAAGSNDGPALGLSTAPPYPAQFNAPESILLGLGGVNVYLSDTANNKVRVITGSGSSRWVGTLAGSGMAALVDGVGTGAAFFAPRGLAQSPFRGGLLVVADSGNNAIRSIVPETGITTTLAGGGPRALPMA